MLDVKPCYSVLSTWFPACRYEQRPSDGSVHSVRRVTYRVRATSAMRGLFLRVKMSERAETIHRESTQKRHVLVDMPEKSVFRDRVN